MILSKKDLEFYIQEDLRVNKSTDSIKYWLGFVIGREKSHIIRWLKSYRHYEYTFNNRNRSLYYKLLYLICRLRFNRLSFKYKLFVLQPNTIGYGLKIAHLGGGIIINCIKMGNYCSVSSGVVIGNKDSQENRATIGDHVAFTLGSKAIGKINIGDNVTIAPNSVVVKDIPSDCVVSGVPAVIIKKKK